MATEYDPYEENSPRCGRECVDGSPCERLVPMEGVPCHAHQR